MKIAYVTIHVAPEIMWGGVGKKIAAQIDFWRTSGYEVTLFSLTPAPIPFENARQFFIDAKNSMLNREWSRAVALRRLVDALRQYHPDVIYLRYGLYAYPLHRLFDVAPVVVEINTNDLEEYATRGRFFYWVNRLTRGITLGFAAGIVSPTYELTRTLPHGKNRLTTVISNGADVNTIAPLPAPNNNKPIITLVGSPGMSWHGVDKLIGFASLHPDVQVHIVGCTAQDVNMTIPSNATLHGILDQAPLHEVYKITDVACSGLAAHRKNMHESCALKVREALSHGIPLLLANEDTDLMSLEMDTILRIPNTETNVKEYASQIRSFCYKMRGRRLDMNVIGPRIDHRKKEDTRLRFLRQVLDHQKRA